MNRKRRTLTVPLSGDGSPAEVGYPTRESRRDPWEACHGDAGDEHYGVIRDKIGDIIGVEEEYADTAEEPVRIRKDWKKSGPSHTDEPIAFYRGIEAQATAKREMRATMESAMRAEAERVKTVIPGFRIRMGDCSKREVTLSTPLSSQTCTASWG